MITKGSSPTICSTASTCICINVRSASGRTSPSGRPGAGTTNTSRSSWKALLNREYSWGPDSALSAGKHTRFGRASPLLSCSGCGACSCLAAASKAGRRWDARMISCAAASTLPALISCWYSEASPPLSLCCSPPAVTGAGRPADWSPASPSSARMNPASAVGVGKSKVRVAGSRSPVAALRRLRSSTAVRESSPSSTNARPSPSVSVLAWPSTPATSV